MEWAVSIEPLICRQLVPTCIDINNIDAFELSQVVERASKEWNMVADYHW